MSFDLLCALSRAEQNEREKLCACEWWWQLIKKNDSFAHRLAIIFHSSFANKRSEIIFNCRATFADVALVINEKERGAKRRWWKLPSTPTAPTIVI